MGDPQQHEATARRWAQVAELFDALVDLTVAERVAMLDARCGHDVALREEVEALLASSAQASSFMTRPAREYVAPLFDNSPVNDEPAPVRVGPFRVVRELGRGGMGTVYLAERDDAQFVQTVALKLARSAFADDGMARRFYDERQMLAWLTHPNIAGLVDGGVTEGGQPWFAMEYVDGIPIDRYCDANGLSVEQRLALFTQVCDAVEQAHRKLIVHRDLKPANILVSATGQVKLLDFGIAKLLDPTPLAGGAGDTRTTRYLTPEYASPEQLRGDPITTATDVYALGLLLYQLLTGRHPHRNEEVSLAAWAKRFSEPPLPPSALLPDDAAVSRATTAQQLRRRLRGDLDAIVLRALEPEPDARYRSVEQLATDVRRHLAGRTVYARRASRGYALRTFVRRHRVGVSSGLLAVTLIMSFAVVTALQSRRIRSQAERIATERDKATQVSRFLVDMIGHADPYRAGGTTPNVRDVIDRGAARVMRDLTAQPETRGELLYAIGEAYFGLGEIDRAGEMLDTAVALERRRTPESIALARNLNYLAQIRRTQRRAAEAETLYREALRQKRRLLAPSDPGITLTLSGLGSALQAQGKRVEAEATLRSALALERARQPIDTQIVAQLVRNLAHALRDQARRVEAETLYRETLVLHRAQFGAEHPEAANDLINLGSILFKQGRPADAEPLLREGLRIKTRLLGAEHWDVLIDQLTLADVLADARRFREADTLYAQTLSAHRRLLPSGDRQIGDDLYGYGMVRMAMGDSAAARTSLREAVEIYRKAPLRGDMRLVTAERLLAGALAGVR